MILEEFIGRYIQCVCNADERIEAQNLGTVLNVAQIWCRAFNESGKINLAHMLALPGNANPASDAFIVDCHSGQPPNIKFGVIIVYKRYYLLWTIYRIAYG